MLQIDDIPAVICDAVNTIARVNTISLRVIVFGNDGYFVMFSDGSTIYVTTKDSHGLCIPVVTTTSWESVGLVLENLAKQREAGED